MDLRNFSISAKEISGINGIEMMLINLLLFPVGENKFNPIRGGFIVVHDRYLAIGEAECVLWNGQRLLFVLYIVENKFHIFF